MPTETPTTSCPGTTTHSDIVASWSLDRVVGQLLCISVGQHTDGSYGFVDSVDEIGKIIADKHIGGICYFPVGDDGPQPSVIADQVRTLQARSVTPLLITIDQEGGLVTRMREPATRWPSAMGQQASRLSPAAIAQASGLELRAAGVNQTFAPNGDVNLEPRNPVIGLRSASSVPETVADFVTDSLHGFHTSGIAGCVKHFPGHGDTQVDSHFGLPVLDTDLETWEATESLPFKAGIAAGADSIMIGHLCAPKLDPSGRPATFSSPIVTGLLREHLGFDGVIVTDALDMDGAVIDGEKLPPSEVCILALQAGIDQLLMPRDPASCVDGIIDAVNEGRLDEARLRASATRILALKDRLGILQSPLEPAPIPDLSSHHRLARRAITSSVAWRDVDTRFRLSETKVDIFADPLPPSAGRGVEDLPGELARILSERGFNCAVMDLDGTPRDGAQQLLVVRDAWRFNDISERVSTLDVDCVIAGRSPYDSSLFDVHVPVLLGFGDIPGLAEAVAAVLVTGVALGRLPIDLPTPGGTDIAWPTRPGPEITIRRYRPDDRDAIGRICIRTGDSGKDATGKYSNDEILPYIYAYPYLEYDPDLCLVVDVGGDVVGYILGVADVSDFAAWWEQNWTHVIAEKFPDNPHWSTTERALVEKGLHPENFAPQWREEHPAEFHIDLMDIVQGEGLGRMLVDQFVALLKDRNVPSLAIGVGARNSGGVAFYRHLGFDELFAWKNSDGDVLGYIMALEVS